VRGISGISAMHASMMAKGRMLKREGAGMVKSTF
jgi:hypothetical protein